MKILYVASEANPYAGSGGLGDVLGALPGAIRKADPGCDVSVILPLYKSMKEDFRKKMKKVCDLSFNLSWRSTGASVFLIENAGVRYYFIENHFYFDRPMLYGEYDDAERFAFFSMAVIQFMLKTGEIPDILHANDWQSAAVVIYLKTIYGKFHDFRRLRTVYTIHNIEYQGKFPREILGDVFSLDDRFYPIVEFDGCINLMKGAISVSDYVSTVSPNYASELRYDFFAFGLAGVIGSVAGKISGVINGIDYGYFSPEVGGDIVRAYGESDLSEGKAANKAALQREVGLPERDDVPLYVMITRLASQKGIDLVGYILDEFLSGDVQFVILGTGEKDYEDLFRRAEAEHPDKMRALIRFDRALSKRMYAAADIFVMPSKSEPCGLAQMIACSYGTVPVVRAVGGLYDSIKPYGTEGANGFTFGNYNAHDLLAVLRLAGSLYADTEKWSALRLSAKRSDFSWDVSAKKYLELYNNLLKW